MTASRHTVSGILIAISLGTATSYTPSLTSHLAPSTLGTRSRQIKPRSNGIPGLRSIASAPNLGESLHIPQTSVLFPSRIPVPQGLPLRTTEDETASREAKEAVRRQMMDDAMQSSKLATALYFQAVNTKEQCEPSHAPAHVERSCPVRIEKAYKSFNGNDCVVCKGDICELADVEDVPSRQGSISARMMGLLSGLGQGKLSGFHHAAMEKSKVAEVDPEVSWHESLSRTLSIMGISNRMDATTHEESHFLDVVIDRVNNPQLQWAQTRGLVLQLLTPKTLRGNGETCSYVKVKTETLERAGWSTLTVQWDEWSALRSDEERISYLAVKLAAHQGWSCV